MSRYVEIDRLVQTFWNVLYDYEDRTEKAFIEHEELDVSDWFQHRIFVQAIFGELLKAVVEAPSVEISQAREISFEEDLEALRESGLTHEQTVAIWELVIKAAAFFSQVEPKKGVADADK